MFSWRRTEVWDHLRAHWNTSQRPEISAVPLTSLIQKGQLLERCQTRSIPSCIDPFLLIASNGMIGLCPWTARTGDVIAILSGGKVPYLLRESGTTGDSNGETRYTLVGECFVMGVMKGEYFEAQKAAGKQLDRFALI